MRHSIYSFLYTTVCVFFISTPAYSENYSSWYTAIPPNFNDVEDFFNQANCLTILGVSYVYDIKSGNWLSHQKAKAKYNDELYLALQNPRKSELGSCKINATKAELENVFGIELEQSSGQVLFFFDAFYTVNGERSPFMSDFDNKMVGRYDDVSKFDEIPKYHIKMNSIGMQTQ